MHKLSLSNQANTEITATNNGFQFSTMFSKVDSAANDASLIGDLEALLSTTVFRVTNITREEIGRGQVRNEANLYCNQANFKVEWIDTDLSRKIQIGQIVSPRLSTEPITTNGCTRIKRLVVYERPMESVNLFDLIPLAWVKDRNLVKSGAVLMNELSDVHRLLFNAIFWDHSRFEKFCKQPSSMTGHHSEPSGNLRHTVEVVKEMRNHCLTRIFINRNLR